MARFRAPSTTPSVASDHAQTQRRLAEATLRPQQAGARVDGAVNRTANKAKGKAKGKGKGRARTPAPMGAGHKEKLKMSMKQRRLLPQNLRPRGWCHLYVGNLHRSHGEEFLKRFFQNHGCGKVFRVVVRTTTGIPVASHISMPSSRLDRRYASVEFTDVFAIHRALALDGSLLNGVRIKVCLTPDELPEIRELVQEHVRNKVESDNRTLVRRALQAFERITVQRTLRAPIVGPSVQPQAGPSNIPQAGPSRAPQEASQLNPQQADTNRTRLMGMSFAKTIV